MKLEADIKQVMVWLPGLVAAVVVGQSSIFIYCG